MKSIPGQRIVSTHSPYFAGQADLSDLRLFIRNGGETTVSGLDLSTLNGDETRKLRHGVVNTRGDLLFARAAVFFEGETEEQALPILAEAYWGRNIHELGFSFVRVGGHANYFPFMWLAERLEIPWYVFSDGEADTVGHLGRALHKSGKPNVNACPNVFVIPDGRNFETQLVADNYLPEIEAALDKVENKPAYLDQYIQMMHGKSGKKNIPRDYHTTDGREKAACDIMSENKTRMAEPLASSLCAIADESRRYPAHIRVLFEKISADHGLTPAGKEGP